MYQITKPFVLAVCGVIFIVGGLLLHFYLFNLFVDYKIKKAIVLEDDSEALHRWEKPPSLDFKIYFFNVTNPLDVHYGAKPILREVGPYIYTEYHDKKIIKFHDEDDTVSYNVHKRFFYNKEKSQCHHDSDLVTIINPALMGTVLRVQKMFPYALTFINDAIPFLFPTQNTIFVTATVQEILFDGILINCTHDKGPGKMVCDGMTGRIPKTIRQVPNSQNYLFSYFHHKNDSLIGPFRIMRGRRNITRLGQIKMYEEKKQLDVWPDNSTCNVIRGTDSTIFPPSLTKSDTIYIFVPDVCGSMSAEFQSEETVQNVMALKFIGSKKNFADPMKYEQNKCHCEEEENQGQDLFDDPAGAETAHLSCPKEGVMYLQACYKAPVIFSQPHFYMADDEYLKFVDGLQPNKSKHETFVRIEPKTGTPLEGYKRLQMNMFLKEVSDIKILNNVTTGLMPSLWIEEGFKLDDENLSKLISFYHLIDVVNFFPYLLIFVGVITVLIAIFFTSSQKNFVRNILSSANNIKTGQNQVAESGVHPNHNTKIIGQESTVESSFNGNNKDDATGQITYTTLAEYRNYRHNTATNN